MLAGCPEDNREAIEKEVPKQRAGAWDCHTMLKVLSLTPVKRSTIHGGCI